MFEICVRFFILALSCSTPVLRNASDIGVGGVMDDKFVSYSGSLHFDSFSRYFLCFLSISPKISVEYLKSSLIHKYLRDLFHLSPNKLHCQK